MTQEQPEPAQQEVKVVPLKKENLDNLSGKQSTLQELIEGARMPADQDKAKRVHPRNSLELGEESHGARTRTTS